MNAQPQPDPGPTPSGDLDDERQQYISQQEKLFYERKARRDALDEEVRQRAEGIRRYEEQKRAKRAEEEREAHRSTAEILTARIDGNLAKVLRSVERHRQEMAEREAQAAEAAPEPPKPAPPEVMPVAQILMFPQWGDERRAASAAIFRSALFPPLNFQKARPYLEEAQIYATKGIEIYFTGKQFDQSDLDVYLELLHIAREYPFGVECCFTAYGFLKALGRATGKANHKWLHSVLIRLCAGVVDMTDHKTRYFGHLVESGIKDEITKHYRVRLNPEMARVFQGDLWASIDIQQRRDLKQNQTAKALHAYYSSHANPGPHRYETLAAIIGLKNSSPKDLKRQLGKAHAALKEVGSLSDFEAGTDTITPKVNHTPSQNRHIIKKLAAPQGTRPQRRKIDGPST